MTKVEEQESNDNEASIQSSTSKENDIKNQLRKNHNKKKVNHEGDLIPKKVKKVSGSYWRDPCKDILEILKKDEKASLFRHPAVKSFRSQRDKEYYKEKIKEPRDLGTITKKLKHENYTPKEFRNDIELCWSNAISFNEDDTEVYKYALYLKDLSDKLFKEKGFDYILEKYNNEKDKETSNSVAEEKDLNMNDNTNNSNNNTNDSNNTGDKINFNEILENGIKEKNGVNSEENDSGNDKAIKKDKKRKDSIETNSSVKSNKDDDSYNGNKHKKHHHHKLTGKKRRRHRHKKEDKGEDKDKDKEKAKEENNEEEKKEKKRGRKRRKIDNDDIIKISKKKINFDDIKKKYPINYPVIASPEEIEKMTQKKGKNKIKKMVKLNNKNHDNHHKRRAKNANNNKVNNINIVEKDKKATYKFDWQPLEKDNEQDVDYILIDNQNESDRRRIENEQMANYDINCNSDNTPNVPLKLKNTITNHSNINSITEVPQKKKKNEITKNKNIINNNINDINNVNINNNETDENKNINNIEIVQKSNNVSIDNSINEIKMVTEPISTVKIVDKSYEKSMELRIEIARYFDNLTDSNMIDLLVYIENIRPQSIRILENDTIYIDMEAFNEDTFNRVIEYIKNIV